MNKKFTTLSVPTKIFHDVKKFIANTGFPSVSSFAAYLLREIVTDKKKARGFSRRDEAKIKRRLKEMGYL